MINEDYYIARTCKSCGNADKFYLTKREKAFGLYDSSKIWKANCSKCCESECLSIGGHLIEIDKELIMDWGNDESLFFIQQDEDLILAEEKYLYLILDILDNHEILETKRRILVSALFVLIYDNLVNKEENNLNLLNRVSTELLARKELIENSSDNVMDYIRNITFPYLGIES